MKLTFLKLMTLMFIGLKLCGEIDWSWWLVWLPYIIDFSATIIAAILKAIANK